MAEYMRPHLYLFSAFAMSFTRFSVCGLVSSTLAYLYASNFSSTLLFLNSLNTR